MKLFLAALFFVIISPLQAQTYHPNMEDKKDNYSLTASGQTTGEVSVETKFVEEPLGAPVLVTVSLTCRQQNSKPTAIDSFKVYDYGSFKEPSRLSSFDEKLQELKVYYVTSKAEAGRAVRSEEKIKVFDLLNKCNK